MEKEKKYVTTRTVYKAVKKYDHQQFDEFCTRVYMNGYEDGKKAVPGMDIEEMLKTVSNVKGVGPALARHLDFWRIRVENSLLYCWGTGFSQKVCLRAQL